MILSFYDHNNSFNIFDDEDTDTNEQKNKNMNEDEYPDKIHLSLPHSHSYYRPSAPSSSSFFSYPSSSSSLSIPKKIDWSPYTFPIRKQKSLGCCVSICLTTCMHFILLKKYGKNAFFSPLFLYYVTMMNINGPRKIHKDTGSTLVEGFQALETYGVCLEKYWPFQKELIGEKPSPSAFRNAENYRFIEWTSVPRNLNTILQYLADGYLICAGLYTYSSFYKNYTLQTGDIILPKIHKERYDGAHAVVIIGYNQKRKTFIMQNSWGTNVGQEGLFHLPYEYLLRSEYCTELAVMLDVNF